MIRRIFAPVVSRSTYRRWAYLVLGGALLVPFVLFAAVVVPSMVPLRTTATAAVVLSGAITLVLVIASSFVPALRVLEGVAVRELLGDPVPEATLGTTRTWRSSAMWVVHLLAGGVVSVASVGLPVAAALSRGWLVALAPLAVVGLCYAVAGIGAVLTQVAMVLLGPSPGERIAQLERRAEQLAERDRLARELHDSVGHALSVVSIQAGAARRTLASQPESAERALLAIEESARAALEDLDHVLGLLREEEARAPQAGLERLPSLFSATELAIDSEVTGDLEAVAPVVSRQAYRILQECLTNVLRHAGRVPVTVRLCAGDGELRLTVRNPLGTAGPRAGGGRGLQGIAERVDVLRGEFRAGRTGQDWEVAVRLPSGSAS